MIAVLLFGTLFAYVDQPAGCWKRSFPCAIRTQNEEVSTEQFVLKRDSAALIVDSNRMNFLSGEILVTEHLVLETPERDIHTKGPVLLRKARVSSPLRIFNLGGEIRASGLLHIPVGFQSWMDRTNRRGELEQGVPSPLSKEMSRDFAQAVEQASTLYQQSVELRSIASERRERDLARRQARVREEQEQLRRMFRQKFHNPELD